MKNSFFSFAALLVAQVAAAAPQASNPGTPFQALMDEHEQLQQSVNQIEEKVDSYNAIGLPDTVERVEIKVSLPKVEARVDTRVCTSMPAQCPPGQQQPAMDGNDRPIRMFVLVVSDGQGVEELTADAFAFDNPFGPAGAPQALFCRTNCGTSWFQAEHNGLYSIFLEPPANTNWKAGQYAATLTVTVPLELHNFSTVGKGTALVTFEIPPALN